MPLNAFKMPVEGGSRQFKGKSTREIQKPLKTVKIGKICRMEI
jgi:hypothetical protein